jgi:hypothetical protein
MLRVMLSCAHELIVVEIPSEGGDILIWEITESAAYGLEEDEGMQHQKIKRLF